MREKLDLQLQRGLQKIAKDVQVCKQASKAQRDLQVIGTLTFTINGEISVFYKLEDKGERKRREKVNLDLKLQGKVAKVCQRCVHCVTTGVFKDNLPKFSDLRIKTRFLCLGDQVTVHRK